MSNSFIQCQSGVPPPHNPEVVDSNPAPATNTDADLVKRVGFSFPVIDQAQKKRKSFSRFSHMMRIASFPYPKTDCMASMATRCWSMFTCV